ncbi:Metallo-dependent phosphatase [Tricholoma matsutake]|nr:Metallo-dependent phosphatase [Tricholoma matsutake 945]
MFPVRQVLAYSVVTFFVLFFFSDGLSSRVNSLYLLTKNHPPEFSRYREMRTLPPDQFPLDDPHRRVIIVGDVHGMHKQLSALLHGLSFEQPSDVFIHVGDIISKGSHDGSMAVLSYMTSNNITGVRGNHDQKVIEWRGWINWIRSLPEGKEWFEKLDTRWVEAEADGASPDLWVEKEKKKNKSKWWKTIPKDWILFGDHYKVARGMSKAQYDYLLSLPLRLYIPSAHTFIVHGGLLPSNPLYPPGHSRQPLAHVPNLPLAITKGKSLPKNDTIAVMRGLQELSLLEDVPQNKVPWTVLNLRSILSGMVSNRKDGKAWPKIWKHDMSRCEGFDHDVPTKPKDDLLPCYPFSIIYGHTASRGLDVHRWSFGLDTGCVYKRRLTALVLGPQNLHSVSFKRQEQGDKNEEDSEYDIDTVKSVPFGDNGQASVVSISCS